MGVLDGKVAVISGALGGMGLVACERFAAEGATVIGVDRAPEAPQGFAATYRQLDVTDRAGVRELAGWVAQSHDAVHILYNNAGVNLGKPLQDTTDDEWDSVLAVNVTSVFSMTRAFAPLLKAGRASVINVSSVAALVTFANSCAYNTSKAAVAMLTKSSAVDLGPEVRVNAICPGIIQTPMPMGLLETLPEPEETWKLWESGAELGRVGQPEEVVALALFLASDASSFMTGAIIPVDGGWNLR
jgi:NAD(P)-dependent dehydrogenase (short-subunit alcohol dehydrogenase family)